VLVSPATSLSRCLAGLFGVVLGAVICSTTPVWLGNFAPLVAGLMIGAATTGIAVSCFLGTVRVDRAG